MEVLISPFEMRDYPVALALWKSTEGLGLSSADESGAIEAFLLRNPSLSFKATIDGQLVGTILCGHDGRRGLIHHLVTVVIASEMRRRQSPFAEWTPSATRSRNREVSFARLQVEWCWSRVLAWCGSGRTGGPVNLLHSHAALMSATVSATGWGLHPSPVGCRLKAREGR